MSEKPIREYDRFILRLPDGLRERLASRAKANERSMNAEVIQILEEGMDETSTARIRELEDILRGIERDEQLLRARLDEIRIRKEAAKDELMRRKMVNRVRAKGKL